MKFNRSKNSFINILSGIFNKAVNMILPFAVRTVIIQVLGVEYLGLNSLFTSILQILNIAELGFGQAIVSSMYKPVAEDDTDTICALLNTYRKIYYVIGAIVLVAGLICIPFLPYFIHGEHPENISLIWVYLAFLTNTVVGYFFFAYKSSILYAHQKAGTVSTINTLICILQNAVQIAVLFVFKNYYVYIIIMPICTILYNIFLAIVVKKQFPQYFCKGQITLDVKKSIVQKTKGLLLSSVCNTTRNAFDSIFISAFIGLSIVAIYGNYYYIIAAIFSVLTIITQSILAVIGNSIATESVEKNYEDFCRLNFAFMWIVGVCTACLLCLYQPFMKIWVGEDLMFPFSIVILFCLYFYIISLGSIRAIYHDAIGLWWEARFKSIIETIANLVLNVVLTILLGALGTILGTVLSLFFINYCYGSKFLFKYYFKQFSLKRYFLEGFIYTIVILFSCVGTFFITDLIPVDGIGGLAIKLCVCLMVSNLCYLIAFGRCKYFKEWCSFLKKHILNRSHRN